MADKFFSYHPDAGFETHATAELAKADAEAGIQEYREEAHEGWDELVEHICWGEIKQVTAEQPTGQKMQFDGEEVDCVDYQLADL